MLQYYQPDLLFYNGTFHKAFQIGIDDQGYIREIGPAQEKSAIRLKNQALLPGLCNAHSHAFQRALRGYTQCRGSKTDSFWTWRKSMYQLVEKLTPEDIYHISAICFSEMLLSGITTVGEFHYLHHNKNGKAYQNANELGIQVLRAARDMGIRICLLDVAYERGGVARFRDSSVNDYLKRIEDLRSEITANQSLGIAPHSIRAVSRPWLENIRDYAKPKGVPLHMHVHEQPKEIEECKREYGEKSPLAVLYELGILQEHFTGVHATHTDQEDRKFLQETKSRVCACPTTERDLGDGILDADDFHLRKIPICFGTDSQIVINLWEEARSLEGHLRLKHIQRNVLSSSVPNDLFEMATANGAKSLGIAAGKLAIDKYGDFITVDLNHISLIGSNPDNLLTYLLFSMERGAIQNVYVAGKPVVENFIHPKLTMHRNFQFPKIVAV